MLFPSCYLLPVLSQRFAKRENHTATRLFAYVLVDLLLLLRWDESKSSDDIPLNVSAPTTLHKLQNRWCRNSAATIHSCKQTLEKKTIGRIGFDARVSNHEFIVELSIFTCLVAKLDGFTQFDFSEQIGLLIVELLLEVRFLDEKEPDPRWILDGSSVCFR